MNAILEQVKQFATIAHGDQKRKYSNEIYIEHPIRVMETCRKFTLDIGVLAAALLHDVLEDTSVSEAELKEFLLSVMEREQADRTLALVVALTDQFTKENYPKLNRKSRKALEVARLEKVSPEAQTIKYADIMDNALNILYNDPDFARVYLREGRGLLAKMDKGNQKLYSEARALIDKALMKASKSQPNASERVHQA